MTDTALCLHDLHVRFGATEILRGVGFTVQTGQCHAVIGPNGAGKSTLFDVISGRTAVASGRVEFFGADITGCKPIAIQRLGLARSFQRASVFGRLSVYENLSCAVLRAQRHGYTFWRRLDRLDDVAARTEAVLAQVGLQRRRDLPAGSLAYADSRALDLGIALAGDSRVLLLDEPTAGMSSAEAAAMVELIRTLKPDKTVVIIEHDMSVVYGLADTVTVLADGKVLGTGSPRQVLRDARVVEAYPGTASAP
jgi:branched-chain amino acid transport system ATP-binding protein